MKGMRYGSVLWRGGVAWTVAFCLYAILLSWSTGGSLEASSAFGATCIPSEEICGNGIDEDCSGSDLPCAPCKPGPIPAAGCTCNDLPRYSGYCCESGWQTTPCGGQIYHVDVTGMDSDDGSEHKPWASPGHALARVKAGDTVLINPGHYVVREQISIRTSGEKDRPIIIRGNGQGVVMDFTECPARNAFEVHFASYIVIENLTVYASREANSRGIRLTHSNGSVVRNNIVSGAGHANLFSSLSDHVTFEGNEAYHGLIGLYVADSSDYPVVRGNILRENSGIGLHMNGDIHSGGDGIISYALVENNLIFHNEHSGINCDGVTHSVFRNNVLYDNKKRGIAFFKGDGAVPSEDNMVIHNTVVMPPGAFYGIGANYGAYRNAFYNNIILCEGNTPCFSTTGTLSQLAIKSDYNLLSKGGYVGEIAEKPVPVARWKSLGYDKHSREGSMGEVFADPKRGDYRPGSSSPAIGGGSAGHSYGKDKDGRIRPSGDAPDLGAYEFASRRYPIEEAPPGQKEVSKAPVPSPQPLHGGSVVAAKKDQAEKEPQEEVALGETFRNMLGMTFVFVPAGPFEMGLVFQDAHTHAPQSSPRKAALTRGFFLQTTEVTQGQWKKLMGNNPSYFVECGDDCPVEQVSWHEVEQFIKKLNRLEGTDKYRLPFEAEWEYACRAGEETPFAFGGCLTTGQANYNGEFSFPLCEKGIYREATVETGSLTACARGLHDMHGNVWEWCQDWFGPYRDGILLTDPRGPESASEKVIRGGGWNSHAHACQCGARSGMAPDKWYANLGFRVVMEP